MQNTITLVLNNNYFKLTLFMVSKSIFHNDFKAIEIAILQINESLSEIKETLSSLLSSETNTENLSISVSDYIDNKIDAMQSLSFLNKGKPYSENTIRNWIKFKNNLEFF